MELNIYNKEGQDTGRKINLSDDVFGIEPNEHAIYLDVKLKLANRRQGTHKTKEKSDVSGSTRKLKKQKGTGGARAGSIKSPVFVGGARAFGPQPRDYSFKLNKKVMKLARKSALSRKVKTNSLMVVEDFSFDSPKTKDYQVFLNNLGINAKKTLLILPEVDKNLVLSARNLQKTHVALATHVDTYSLMNANKIVFLESAVGKIETLLNQA